MLVREERIVVRKRERETEGDRWEERTRNVIEGEGEECLLLLRTRYKPLCSLFNKSPLSL